jgi:hypothetical protein
MLSPLGVKSAQLVVGQVYFIHLHRYAAIDPDRSLRRLHWSGLGRRA